MGTSCASEMIGQGCSGSEQVCAIGCSGDAQHGRDGVPGAIELDRHRLGCPPDCREGDGRQSGHGRGGGGK